MKHVLLLIAGAGLLAGTAGPPRPAAALTLSLEEAIALAQEKSPSMLRAREEVSIARSRLTQARSAFMPKIDATLTYMPDSLEKVPESPVDFSQMIPEEYRQAMGEGLGDFEFDMTYDLTAEITVAQPLFTGGKIRNANRQADLNVRASREKLRQARNELVYSVTQAFEGVILAREFITVVEEAEQLAREQLEVTRAQYRAGEVFEFEVLRAEVELSKLRPRVIEARNGRELASLALKNLLGVDPGETIEVQGSLGPSEFDLGKDQCIETALERRPELTQLDYQREIVRRSVLTARAGYIPDLAAVFRYSQQSNDVPGEWTEGYNGLLVLSVPLFNGFLTHGRINEAKGMLTAVSIGYNQLKDGVIFEVERAYLKLRETGEIVEATRETVSQAERSVEIARDQYAAGLITSLDMMGARLGLTQARTNHLKSLYDFIVARAQLEKAMGTIGENH